MTDVWAAICIVAMMITVFGICVFGLAKGKPLKIVAPINDYGGLCGYNGLESTPYLYYPLKDGSAAKSSYTNAEKSICISKCPTNTNFPSST